MWIRRRWPNSINRWPRWWTPGSSNKWVRVQCDQPEFFNKFLCMKTFLLQWNSLLQLHHSYTDNYAVVALSKIRHKWRWYTQGNEAFYWARRLPNSAFVDIYRMIGLRSRYPFYKCMINFAFVVFADSLISFSGGTQGLQSMMRQFQQGAAAHASGSRK